MSHIRPVLPNNMNATVYITRGCAEAWGVDINRVPGLIRNGDNIKSRRVTSIHYIFPSNETSSNYLAGYIVIGGVQVEVISIVGGSSWGVRAKNRKVVS